MADPVPITQNRKREGDMTTRQEILKYLCETICEICAPACDSLKCEEYQKFEKMLDDLLITDADFRAKQYSKKEQPELFESISGEKT